MAVDYRERRAVPAKNTRPRKQPISMVVVGFALVIIAAYGLGIATGWLFFRLTPNPTVVAKPANVQLPSTTTVPAQDANQVPPAGVPNAGPITPAPLTFYDTLPKGEKAVMGSGLNPKAGVTSPKTVPESTAAEKTLTPHAASPQSAAPPPAAGKSTTGAATPVPVKSTAPANDKKGRYSVQVASIKDKAGAESIKLRLAEHGKPAYVVVTTLPDKGTWYRVRIGHQLDEGQAKQLAKSLGGGAVIVTE